MIEEVRPGVVRVGNASGVIFEIMASDGSALVLTNYHVIEGLSRIDIMVNDSSTYVGDVVGIDRRRDLAVLRICCGRFKALPFGDGDTLSGGERVVAIGYPLSLMLGDQATVTDGIVSAIRPDRELDRYLIQTNAAINPGNSGGPLFNINGEVVGLNTSKFEEAFGRQVESIAFAVSEVTVRRRLPELLAGTSIALPTPTPQPEAPGGKYSNKKYWYTIDVPSGWRIDASMEDHVAIWDPVSGSMVMVSFLDEIIPDQTPTLDTYIPAGWGPSPGQWWTDVSIMSERRVRRGLPIEAHEFLLSARLQGSIFQVRTHWYVLGKYLTSVEAIADKRVWEFARYSELLDTLKGIQESFQPSNYTSSSFGYSLAHPPDWGKIDFSGADYSASDSLPEIALSVRIFDLAGHSDIEAAGRAFR